MPIKIPNDLPAAKTLREENIFVMNIDRAERQDIRPPLLRIMAHFSFTLSCKYLCFSACLTRSLPQSQPLRLPENLP